MVDALTLGWVKNANGVLGWGYPLPGIMGLLRKRPRVWEARSREGFGGGQWWARTCLSVELAAISNSAAGFLHPWQWGHRNLGRVQKPALRGH